MSEHTLPEHVEAVEMVDNGVRLAAMMERELLSIADAPVTAVGADRLDGLGADPEPEIDEGLILRVAARVAEFRDEAAADLKRLDRHAPRHLHVEALALVARLDEFLAAVGEHFRGEPS